jgi:hypothetical protein
MGAARALPGQDLPRKMESSMSKSKQIVLVLAFAAALAACAKKEAEVVYVDEPVTVEPTYTGKYK